MASVFPGDADPQVLPEIGLVQLQRVGEWRDRGHEQASQVGTLHDRHPFWRVQG